MDIQQGVVCRPAALVCVVGESFTSSTESQRSLDRAQNDVNYGVPKRAILNMQLQAISSSTANFRKAAIILIGGAGGYYKSAYTSVYRGYLCYRKCCME